MYIINEKIVQTSLDQFGIYTITNYNYDTIRRRLFRHRYDELRDGDFFGRQLRARLREGHGQNSVVH